MSRYYNKKKSKDLPQKTVDDAILGILEREFETAEKNEDQTRKDFDDFYNMLHCIRDKKPNDWESDICLPEFTARILTQIGNFVSRYFSSRDYVESDTEESESPDDIAQAKAGKKLINSILNHKDNHYFEKLCRLMMFAFPGGYGVIKGGYVQRTEQIQTGVSTETSWDTDEFGNFLSTTGEVYGTRPGQRLSSSVTTTPVFGTRIIEDRPVFDVWPTQNVYMSKEYAYSLNDKEFIYFESERDLDYLKIQAEFNNYINLDKLEESKAPEPQKRNKKTSNRDEDFIETEPVSPKFRILERWGKWHVLVQERDPVTNKPVKYKPGVGKDGKVKDGAELHECIITYATKSEENQTDKTLIRFQVSPHSRRPMVRFKVYVDAVDDNGFGDGETAYELGVAINDTFNLGNYRTRLATTPAFKGKRFAQIPQKIKISPENVTLLDNPDDLMEFTIQDNIQGHAYQQQLLTSRMDYVMAVSPTTMGVSPDRRETATTTSVIDQRARMREGYKSMSLEFIGFTEFYDMLLTLVNDFMLPDTLYKILGEDAYNYNPQREYKFKPVSQALETEESKNFKIKMWDQILGRVVNIPNPKTPLLVNYILGQTLELMGGDFKHFKKFMLSEDPQVNVLYQLATGGRGAPAQTSGGMSGGGGPQNQIGLPQGTREQTVRAM